MFFLHVFASNANGLSSEGLPESFEAVAAGPKGRHTMPSGPFHTTKACCNKDISTYGGFLKPGPIMDDL